MKKTISIDKSKYFIGEMMDCIMCKKQEKSNQYVQCEWTVLEVDGHAFYVCPICIHVPALLKGYDKVYEEIILTIVRLQKS